VIVNFSERAHNHNFKDDWIIRSLLDTDFYKLLMCQFILTFYPRTEVTFGLINRSKHIRLADNIDVGELRRQLDHVRSLRFTKTHLIWLSGNTFYSTRGIFTSHFIDFLKDLQLPEYKLDIVDGQIELSFSGSWGETTLWEIYAMAIISEMRTRASLASMTEFEMDIFYARAKAKLWNKIERLKDVPKLAIADFGTRRRHSFLWQEYVVQAMAAGLGASFIGTSNAYLAFKHDMEAIGTNAHELPMVLAALAESDANLKTSQYKVLELWERAYNGALLMMLPDTFGTTQFLRDAPEWVADWTGIRQDSKDPHVEGEEVIAWYKSRGRNPEEKRYLCSDGLDVQGILDLQEQFVGRIKIGFGWGTMLTNDMIGCDPRGLTVFDPISIVCKVKSADGKPAVKLSDNYTKATGPAEEIKRYREIFGVDGLENIPVTV
jgi:nicotinate phosphoribosyltransferase